MLNNLKILKDLTRDVLSIIKREKEDWGFVMYYI